MFCHPFAMLAFSVKTLNIAKAVHIVTTSEMSFATSQMPIAPWETSFRMLALLYNDFNILSVHKPSTSPEKGGSNSQNQRSGLAPKRPLVLLRRRSRPFGQSRRVHARCSWGPRSVYAGSMQGPFEVHVETILAHSAKNSWLPQQASGSQSRKPPDLLTYLV